jgi:N-acetylmuramoyl-L-alanine amidase
MRPAPVTAGINPPLWLSWLLLVGLCLATVPARAANIRDVRLANHDNFVRCVVELDGPPAWDLSNRSGADGVVTLDLRGINAAPRATTRANNLRWVVADAIEPRTRERAARVHLRTDRPVRVETKTIQNPWRLVLDLYEAGAPLVSAQGSTTAPAGHPIVRVGGEYRPRVIVVDPGHGGKHRGGLGVVNGRQVDEAITTLPIALYLEQHLAADPMFEPRLTRRTDVYVGLRERTRRAEQFRGNLFVSIHYNAVPKGKSPTSARGLEFWTWSVKEADNAAAKYLQALNNEEGDGATGRASGAYPVLNKMMLDALEQQALDSVRLAKGLEAPFLRDSHFKRSYRGIKSGRFKVLENYNMPSVLVEVGFISHPEEAAMAVREDFQRKVARLLYEGIVNYYMTNDPLFRAARGRQAGAR